jgi:hypothetical protein
VTRVSLSAPNQRDGSVETFKFTTCKCGIIVGHRQDALTRAGLRPVRCYACGKLQEPKLIEVKTGKCLTFPWNHKGVVV